jgi:hypothetical protein
MAAVKCQLCAIGYNWIFIFENDHRPIFQRAAK